MVKCAVFFCLRLCRKGTGFAPQSRWPYGVIAQSLRRNRDEVKYCALRPVRSARRGAFVDAVCHGVGVRSRISSDRFDMRCCGWYCEVNSSNRCGWMFMPLSSRQMVVQPNLLGARKSFFGLSPT